MDMRVKELIAIGASITANCQPCLEYHVTKARDNGAEEEEIKEAITVGRMVRTGASRKMDQYASEMVTDTATAPHRVKAADGCRLT
jgi:AhpD family alkylhydroperoxidase